MRKSFPLILSCCLLVGLGACSQESESCSETDISAWDTSEPATPVYCESKLVGYQLDIDAKTAAQIFHLKRAESISTGGPLFVSADVDLIPAAAGAVQRSAKISRGGAVYAETTGAGVTVRADAIVAPAAEPLVREILVSIPVGTHYRGQIRNVQQ